MWSFWWVVTEADDITSTTVTKHVVNLTFANMHVRSVLFITCRQGSRLRVALAQIFRMRASTSLFPLTQRYFYRALVLTPIHFFLIKINFEATCESKSSP